MAFLVAIPVLAGMVALGMETGKLYTMQRQMQNAADSAAIAASKDLMAGLSGSVTTDARYEAQRAGFTNGVNGVAVTVNTSVTAPAGQAAYTNPVQVTITKPMSFSFAGVLNSALSSSTTFNMRATSVAAQSTYSSMTSSTSAEGCISALTPNAEQGINIQSFNNFTSDCTVMSNGTATSADSNASIYMANFNNVTIRHNSSNTSFAQAGIWTRGSFYATKAITTDYTQTNQTTTLNDPYASLPTPTPGACSFINYAPSSMSSLTLTPGTYCGGLTVSSINNVYFTAGTYYIANGDLFITSVNNVSCSNCVDGTSGVTIILTQTTGNNADIGGFKISSDNNVTLSAPPSGTYKGVVVYQDRRATAGTMTSTSKIFTLSSLNNAKLSGAIYFPQNRIDLSSLNNAGTSTNGCTVWIGRYIKFSSYNNNYVAGCSTFGTTPVGITTTTTQNVARARVFQ